MHRLVDDLLMAYADGALQDEQKALVAEALARNPEAQRRLAVYRLTGDLARIAYDVPMTAPPPQRIVDAIARTRTPRRFRSRIRSIRRRLAPWMSAERAVIVAVALLAGFAVGSMVTFSPTVLRPAKSEPAGVGRVWVARSPHDSLVKEFRTIEGQWCQNLEGLKVN